MNASSFPSFSNHEGPPPQAAPPDAGQRQAPPPGQHTSKPWFGFIRWIQENSFAPQWLPEPLRHPFIGYLAATLIELAAVSPVLLLLSPLPTFSFYPVFTLLGVVLVALGWGAGPGLLATLLSTLLLDFVVLSPHFTWTISDPADVIGLVLYLVVGASISLLAGRSEWARRQAVENAHLLRQAETQSRLETQRLSTVLDVLPVAVLITNREGQLLRMNQATRTLWGGDFAPGTNITQYPEDRLRWAQTGKSVAPDERSLVRALRSGQAVLNEELELDALDGQRKVILHSVAPIQDESGPISGAVISAQDISEARRLEQRTREILGALVAMAEAMVQIRPGTLPVEAPGEAVTGPAANEILPVVARRLAELTRSVLGCRRVSISAVNAASGQLAPVVEVGLHREQEQGWWASWSPPQRPEERYGQAIAALLYAGESALLDTQQLPEHFAHILFGAESGLIVPMPLGEEMVGTLLVDYQEPDHDYSTAEEILLTETLARLGALVLEQDRLLRGWAETRASELALVETKAQMDTFLGIASHELKTPLTSLKLGLQVAERRVRKVIREKNGVPASTDSGLQPVVEQLSRTTQQVERLSRLVNDLVDVSRIQAGKLELRLDEADLVAIVRGVVEEQEQAAPERTIRLLGPADLSVPVSIDAGRIEQVVTNYLTNALKYSPQDRPVDIGVEVEPEQVRVWVRDQGPGLSIEEQEHIWERFHQVKDVKVQTGAGVGLGLGLYICRMIVERHHGRVGVDSASGSGSTFWFTLPLPCPADVEG